MTDAARRFLTPRPGLPPRPGVLSASVWAYCATAIANVLLTVLTDVLIGFAIAQMAAQGKPTPGGGVVVLLVITGLIAIAYSLALVVFALRLRAGSGRARPALLTISLLSLFVVVTQGPALLLIPLLIGCGIVVTRRPVTVWLRAAQGLSRA